RSPLSAWPGLPGRPVLGFCTGAAVMRRFAFEAAGGFEPRLFIDQEEQLLAVDMLAAGWAAAYVAEGEAHREASTSHQDQGRQELLLRNALWFAWMRRPAGVALAASVRALIATCSDRCQRRAIVQALRGLPWALRRRRVVPVYIENGFRRLAAERPPASVRP